MWANSTPRARCLRTKKKADPKARLLQSYIELVITKRGLYRNRRRRCMDV